MTLSDLNTCIESKRTSITVSFTTRNTPDYRPLIYGNVEWGTGMNRVQRVFRSEEELLTLLQGIE